MKPKIFFYVQHLLGIGHLRRAAILVRAMADVHFDVTLVSGGIKVPSLDIGAAKFLQLPPVRVSDASFNQLVDVNGNPVDESWRQYRKNALLEIFDDLKPHVLITEMFPFGRRQMRFELEPLLDLALKQNPRPHIACSVRDILVQQKGPGRIQEMLERVLKYFDYVLVHGDKDVIAFEETFPLTNQIAEKLVYTGYVAEIPCSNYRTQQNNRRGIVVSAGGGAVGVNLLTTAIKSSSLTILQEIPWLVLLGVNETQSNVAKVKALAAKTNGQVIVETARPDFPQFLRNAKLSISQGGYNTLMDVISSGVKAVIIPYQADGESDQALRTKRLKRHASYEVLDEKLLTPQTLAKKIDRALTSFVTNVRPIDLNGARNTALKIESWLEGKKRT